MYGHGYQRAHGYSYRRGVPMSKLHEFKNGNGAGKLLVFHCPGCGYDHPFHTGGDANDHCQWDWNGSMDKPTFSPSLLVFGTVPERRCHSFVRDGKIEFLSDCFHALKGQTIEIPDYER